MTTLSGWTDVKVTLDESQAKSPHLPSEDAIEVKGVLLPLYFPFLGCISNILSVIFCSLYLTSYAEISNEPVLSSDSFTDPLSIYFLVWGDTITGI